jgi:hypothetical protein
MVEINKAGEIDKPPPALLSTGNGPISTRIKTINP